MTLIRILRELWRSRLLVTVGVAVATLVAILVSYRVEPGLPPQLEARQYHVGVASAGVLVDSPSSQIADVGPNESKADVVSLSARARLLANLLATSPLKNQIARRAGVAPNRLIAIPPTAPGSDPSTFETRSEGVRDSDPTATVLHVYVNELLPIITADAQAPSSRTAARISGAAVTELQLYLRSVAAADKVPNVRQLVLQPLGPPRSATVRRGPRKLYSLIAFVVVFGLWCGSILAASGFARSWRALSDADTDAPARPPSRIAREEPPSVAPPELWEVPEQPRRPNHAA